MLDQCSNHSKQCRNNVGTLCCAKSRRRESSRVTSLLRSTDAMAEEMSLKKVILHSFSLNRDYSYRIPLSNVGEPYWSCISRINIQVQKEKFKFVVACFRPPQNVKLTISRRSRAKTAKKCTKKCDERAELLFCLQEL